MGKEFTYATVMVLLMAAIQIAGMTGTVSGSDRKPTRNTADWTMDMNISAVAEGWFDGEYDGDRLGMSFSGVGDVNDDGYDDFIIGAEMNSDNGVDSGKTYLILGSWEEFEEGVNISNADASFMGEAHGERSGDMVCGAGDVNNDGYDDFLIGVETNGEGGNFIGQVYLILGKSSGWSTDKNLNSVDSSFIGEDDGDALGLAVAGGGDLNGDGYDDLVFSAPMDEAVHPGAGQVYIVFGRSSGWSMDTSISSAAGASFLGENPNDMIGSSLAIVGDVNNDGYDDLVIGCMENGEGVMFAGQTYLIMGKGSGWNMGVLLSNADASFIGENMEDRSGSVVSAAGDVNKDGYDDFLIGSFMNDDGGVDAGKVYLIRGKSSGWSMDTSLANAYASFIGESGGDRAGISCTGVGDLNGDEYDDIMIGAEVNSEGGTYAGQVYFIRGKGTGWSRNVDLSNADASFLGEEGDSWLKGGAGLGDVNGDNGPDILLCAYHHDSERGRAYVVTGQVNTEPLEVYSVKTFSDAIYSNEIKSADLGDTVFIELLGLDGNLSHRDIALVNITFGWSQLPRISVPLKETGNNTGRYLGHFIVPLATLYMDTLRIYSRKDNTKFTNLFIDKPFRPLSVSSVELFGNSALTNRRDKFDKGETMYIKITGVDANSVSRNFAFVNITTNLDPGFRELVILEETGTGTGIYKGEFTVPEDSEFFQNFTIYSVRTESVRTKFMVHTPVLIKTNDDITHAREDSEYSAYLWNFGYETETWTVSETATWLGWNPGTRYLTGTPDNNHVGPWDVLITISDGKGHSDMMKFKINVANTPPKIITPPVTEVLEGDDYYVDFDSDDDGQGVITWSSIGQNDWLSIKETSGELMGRPIGDNVGNHTVSVIVDDGNGGTGTLEFQLNVINRNEKPRILTTDITTGTEGELYYREYEAYDPDNTDHFHWELRTNANFLAIDNDTGVLQGTPGPYDVDVFFVNVTVKDEGGLMASNIFDLEIFDVNSQPEWIDVPIDVEILHGTLFSFDVNATDPDPEGFLDYTVTSDPESDISMDAETGMLEWRADIRIFERSPYDMEVLLRVSDGELFNKASFFITVIPTQPPTSTLIGPANGGRSTSDHILLEWEGSDPEDEQLTYDIFLHPTQAFVEGWRDEALYLEDHEGINLTVTGLEQGRTYYWTVRPFDTGSYGICTSGVQSFRVNFKPTFKDVLEVETAHAGSEFKLKITASDRDPEDPPNLRFSLIESPEGMTINVETGMIRWTPTEDQVRLHLVTVLVTDGIDTNTVDFDIEVKEASSSSSLVFLYIIIPAVLLIGVGIGVFFLLRKKKNLEEEAKRKEEEEAKKKEESLPPDYEALYGAPAPEKVEEMTTEELRDSIRKDIEDLQQMETPEEDFLEQMVSNAKIEKDDI